MQASPDILREQAVASSLAQVVWLIRVVKMVAISSVSGLVVRAVIVVIAGRVIIIVRLTTQVSAFVKSYFCYINVQPLDYRSISFARLIMAKRTQAMFANMHVLPASTLK